MIKPPDFTRYATDILFALPVFMQAKDCNASVHIIEQMLLTIFNYGVTQTRNEIREKEIETGTDNRLSTSNTQNYPLTSGYAHVKSPDDVAIASKPEVDPVIKGLVEALEKASELCEALPELNNGNYDHDEVVDLNNGAVELCLFLRDTLAALPPQYRS